MSSSNPILYFRRIDNKNDDDRAGTFTKQMRDIAIQILGQQRKRMFKTQSFGNHRKLVHLKNGETKRWHDLQA